MRKIKKGDDVVVLTGKDKGRRGTVLRVLPDTKLVIEGVNKVKKHAGHRRRDRRKRNADPAFQCGLVQPGDAKSGSRGYQGLRRRTQSALL
jgi:ribosomal protein L24